MSHARGVAEGCRLHSCVSVQYLVGWVLCTR